MLSLFCCVLGWRAGAFVEFVLLFLGWRAGAFVEFVLLFLGGGAYARPPRGLPWATHAVTRTHAAHYEGRCMCMNHWMRLTVHRML